MPNPMEPKPKSPANQKTIYIISIEVEDPNPAEPKSRRSDEISLIGKIQKVEIYRDESFCRVKR